MKCAILVVTHYVWEESTYIELQEEKKVIHELMQFGVNVTHFDSFNA